MNRLNLQHLLIGGALAWCALIIATPFIAAAGTGETVAGYVYLFFSKVCHQFSSRSFFAGDHPFPVCARCAGIYLGVLSGAIVALLRGGGAQTHVNRLWMVAAVPMVIDVMLGLTGVWTGTLFTRALTGLFFGVAVGWMLMRVVRELEPVSSNIRGNGNERYDAAKT